MKFVRTIRVQVPTLVLVAIAMLASLTPFLHGGWQVAAKVALAGLCTYKGVLMPSPRSAGSPDAKPMPAAIRPVGGNPE